LVVYPHYFSKVSKKSQLVVWDFSHQTVGWGSLSFKAIMTLGIPRGEIPMTVLEPRMASCCPKEAATCRCTREVEEFGEEGGGMRSLERTTFSRKRKKKQVGVS